MSDTPDLRTAEKVLAWGNDLDAPNDADNAVAEYIAECVRFREQHGKAIVTTTLSMAQLSAHIQENERLRKLVDSYTCCFHCDDDDRCLVCEMRAEIARTEGAP